MKKRLLASNSEASVYLISDDTGSTYVAKESADRFLLETEAKMLAFLKPHVRVPLVLSITQERLCTEYIPGDGSCNRQCEAEIADVLANLHDVTATTFGFEYDTTIGPFRQHNPRHERWIDFYRDARVMDFAQKAYNEGRIDATLMRRIESFARDFERYLEEPQRPSLLHGDVWSGNVLTLGNRFQAFIDPAVYYGHYEMEIAFIGMFDTYGDAFYRRYGEYRNLDAGFFDSRAYIYRIFPYLVHVRAFGSSYINGLTGILSRFGY